MKIKLMLTAFVLALAPLAAAAEGCSGRQEASMSCAEGMIWNPTTKVCESSTS